MSPVVSSARFSPDGGWIVTAEFIRAVRIWDTEIGALLTTLLHGSAVLGVHFDTTGEWHERKRWRR